MSWRLCWRPAVWASATWNKSSLPTRTPTISVPRPLSPLAQAHGSCAVCPNARACSGRATPNADASFSFGSACLKPRVVRSSLSPTPCSSVWWGGQTRAPSRVSRDGDRLAAGGRQFVCVVSPGHAEGHLSLWDPAARVLLSGDHLLGRIIPVPSLEHDEGATRRHSLVEYLAGLPRFVAFDPTVVLPGHGRAFTDMAILNARLRAHGRQRADDIAAILAERPATPFELARRLQWHPEGARLLVGLAHVQGHLDLLQEAGRVIPATDGAVARYQLRV